MRPRGTSGGHGTDSRPSPGKGAAWIPGIAPSSALMSARLGGAGGSWDAQDSTEPRSRLGHAAGSNRYRAKLIGGAQRAATGGGRDHGDGDRRVHARGGL